MPDMSVGALAVPAVVLKVHLAHTIGQAIEQEIPMLPTPVLDRIRGHTWQRQLTTSPSTVRLRTVS